MSIRQAVYTQNKTPADSTDPRSETTPHAGVMSENSSHDNQKTALSPP